MKNEWNNCYRFLPAHYFWDFAPERKSENLRNGFVDFSYCSSSLKMVTQNRPSGSTTQTTIAGTHRYKYFKRPIMPRVNAYPPQVLLAPTAQGENNPLIPIPPEVEVSSREMAIQTMYRESEAQTLPYTPEFVIPEGKDDPEVLLLKNLTYNNGLPLGKKQIDMIEFARGKRDMEMNLPPFTDEASLQLRKRLMEQQEMKEFRIRESEIDSKREEKLQKLAEILDERESANDFMSSQRLESIRLLKMEEREEILLKLRNKRIKILRRLAHQRNISDPVLSNDPGRDIITDYFDRGSVVYAPIKREGKFLTTKVENYDAQLRTAPLNNIGNIVNLESSIPRRLLNDVNESNALLSKTAPVNLTDRVRGNNNNGNRIKAAEPRLTSAAQRNLRQTKRDIEEMHSILTQKKYEQLHNTTGGKGNSAPSSRGGMESSKGGEVPGSPASRIGSLLAKKPKGRPPTPDFTRDRTQVYVPPEDEDLSPVLAPTHPKPVVEEVSQFKFDHEFQLAVILLQRLIRGRAVQNIMFEGKYRRRELINELKLADEAEKNYIEPSANEVQMKERSEREERLTQTTFDAVAGSNSIGMLHTLAQEKVLIFSHLYFVFFNVIFF
jgi:hypothetical protein